MYKLAFCSFKLSVGLRLKNLLRVFADSPADLLHGCAELFINILYVIYIGIITYNTQASLMSVFLRQLSAGQGLTLLSTKQILEIFY